jgi:hypothetical protein
MSNIDILQMDTFDSVIKYHGLGYKKIIILDCASGSNPGGGWRGKQVGTQEESLCRRSNLGLLLEQKKYPIPTDGHHYLPKVTITKENISCGVIASELRSVGARTEEYLIKRVENILQCATNNAHDLIVLTGWACGAFKEDIDEPKIMAMVFKKVCAKYKEKIKIVFAILHKKNYIIFKDLIT